MKKYTKSELQAIITEAASKHGVSADHLKIIAGIESSYRPDITGPQTRSGRAKGLFQFTEATAKGYGLKDPYDPVQAADAAARYWKDLDNRYRGDLKLMIADYNGGGAGVRAVKSGKVFAETQGYFDKFNREARKEGLAARIDGSGLAPTAPAKPEKLTRTVASGFRGDGTTPLKSGAVLQMEQEKEFADAQRSFGEAVSDFAESAAVGFKQSNYALQGGLAIADQSLDDLLNDAPDPQWQQEATPDNLVKYLEEAGVDRDQWEYVLEGADNRDNFNARVTRVRKAKEEQERLSQSVGGAVVGSLAGAALDPTFWLSGFAGAGIPMIARAGKVGNLVAGAVAGGVTDAALTSAVGGTLDPNMDSTDVVINGLAGSVGGLVGAYSAGNRAVRADDPPKIPVPPARPFEPEAPESDIPPVPMPEPDPEPPMLPPPREPEDFPEAPVPEPEDLPEAPAGPLDEGPLLPPDEPPAPPRAEPWDASWDQPERVEAYSRGGKTADTLLVPIGLSPKARFDYVLKHGSDREKALTTFLLKQMDGLELVIRDLDPVDKKLAGVGADSEGALRRADMIASADDEVAYMKRNPGYGAWAYRAFPDVKLGKAVGLQGQVLAGRGSKKGITAENLLHETIHSITSRSVDIAKRAKASGYVDDSVKKLVSAYDDLEKALRALRKVSADNDIRVRSAYGMNNTDEFLAELASLPFERAITRIAASIPPSAPSTVLGKLAKAFRGFAQRLLGNSTEANELLDSYYGAAARFMEEANAYRKAELAQITNAPLLPNKGPTFTVMGEVRTTPPTLEEIVKEAGSGTTFGKRYGGFAIENILQNEKMPQAIRALGAKLVGSTAGYRNGEVVGRNAWDDTLSLRKSEKAKLTREINRNFNEWFMSRRKAGMYKGWGVWTREQARRDFNELVFDVKTGMATSDDPQVTAMVKYYETWYDDWVDRINNPGADEGRNVKGLTVRRTEVVDPETGEVKIVEEGALTKDANYAPFRLSVQKLNEAFAKYGSEKVHKLLEEAFYSARPELRDLGKDYGKMFAKWYLKQVLDSRVNAKFDYLHSLETSASGDELVQSMMNAGVDEVKAREIVDALLEKNSGSQAFNANLRRRSTYDRKFAMQMEDGSQLRVYDLIERDMEHLSDAYLNKMSGAIGLAKNFDGVSSYSDFSRLFQESLSREFGSGQITDQQRNEAARAFESAMNHILARPLDDPSNVKLGLAMLRDFNVVTKMGGAVLYQLVEVAQLVGTLGLKNVLRAMPELMGNVRRNSKTGRLSSDELNDLEDLIGGTGTELLEFDSLRMGDEWGSLNGYGQGAEAADKARFGLQKAAGGLLKYTGMTGAMVIEKRLALIAITRHFQDHLLDGKKLRYSEQRLGWMGLDKEKMARLQEAFKKHSKVNDKGRRVLQVREFFEQDPDAFAMWRVALQRESRRVIQENDLGAHIPAMDNGWFKTFTQFRSFVLQAHNKALLFGVNHRDAQTATTLLYAIGLSTMMQYARAHLKAASMDDEKRAEYLSKQLGDPLAPGGALMRGVASISQAALLPQVFDTVSPFGNLFDGYRSTTDASDLFSNPTADLVSTSFGAAKQVAYTVTGQDSIDQRDASQFAKLLPFNNAIGVSQALGFMTEQLPKSTKAELLFDDEAEE